jgi:signal peptidase I
MALRLLLSALEMTGSGPENEGGESINSGQNPPGSDRELPGGCPGIIGRAGPYPRALRLGLAVVLTLVLVVFVRSNVGTFFIVEGPSMYPTFKPDDVVQARTFYDVATPRGEVVIITDNRGERVIKRIIGLPGETVTLYRGFVYINGQRLREPYLPGHTYTFKSNETDERAATWQLQDHEYFVMGDNRLQSQDSRHYGPVERRQIQQVVNVPANEAKPEFCEIMLSTSGKVIRGKPGRPSSGGDRMRKSQLSESSKS